MKDKGFTLVELLAAMVILALLIFVGTMAVSNIFDNTKDNYYHSLENTLSIAGNEYFNDNREDRPIDDYNFVDMDTLVNHEYMDELMTYDGKEKCKSETGVYIYNENSENKYEVCLVCGEYKSEGVYCNGKKSGTIHITGNINDKNGPSYNPLLSYSGTKWINASNIWIHFSLVDEGIKVSKYTIYNANGNSKIGDCTASSNKCSMRFDKTGSYYVEAFDGNNKVGNRKYFNVKLDNTPPTMDLKNLNTEFLLDNDSIVYDYENEVININDDNGYKEVKYTLTRYTPNGSEDIVKDKDIKDEDFKINASLESGKYDLYITVTDFAGNKATQKHTHITFYIKYNVDLQYFDNQDNKHDAGTIKVYTYGKYSSLPDRVNVHSNSQEVSWYLNANLVGNITTSESQVEKTGYHILYGKEAKFKSSFKVSCNSNTYDAKYHQLASIPPEEQGKYRLLVYYDNKLMANEGKDARKYTVIAMLNPEYTWADGTTKAKALQCEILPQKVSKPSCISRIYDGTSQKLVTLVEDNGIYTMFNETAYSLDSKPFGRNATTYNFKVSLSNTKNFSWEGSSDYDFSVASLSCKINPKKVPFNYKCCNNCVFYGGAHDLIQGFNYTESGDGGSGGMQGEQPLVFSDAYVPMTDDIEDLWENFSDFSSYGNEASDYLYATNGEMNDMGGVEGTPVFTVNPFTAINAQVYPVKFEIKNSNYTWDDGSREKTLKCEIKKASVAVKWDKLKFIYDENKHVATVADDMIDDETMYADIQFHVDGETSEVGKHKAKFVCDGIENLRNGCSNVNFSNTTVEFEIKDNTPPKCDSVSVSTDGTITAKASDNYGFDADGKTKTKTTTQAAKTGNNKVKFTDSSGNNGYCEINVKYGANANKCGTSECDCGYRNYHCTGTAYRYTTACSERTYKDCAGTGCSWTGYNYGCNQCAKSCYYE